MCDMVIRMGDTGDYATIIIDWTDHNNVSHSEKIAVIIWNTDKPRTLEIRVNDKSASVNRAGIRE